jgi:hypothetical protein
MKFLLASMKSLTNSFQAKNLKIFCAFKESMISFYRPLKKYSSGDIIPLSCDGLTGLLAGGGEGEPAA